MRKMKQERPPAIDLDFKLLNTDCLSCCMATKDFERTQVHRVRRQEEKYYKQTSNLITHSITLLPWRVLNAGLLLSQLKVRNKEVKKRMVFNRA